MSVPLDRLYNHLDSLCDHDAIIYRFFPHGSKKLDNVDAIVDVENMPRVMRDLKPIMFCHDQEPVLLDFSQSILLEFFQSRAKNFCSHLEGKKTIDTWIKELGLRSIFSNRFNVYDKILLVHSEKNSAQIQALETQGVEPVYWWSHAAIAADWFRYAKHDPQLAFAPDKIHTDFLIYNRSWSGTREYRLKFLELLISYDLVGHCQTSFNPVDNNVHYKNFLPVNADLATKDHCFEQVFEPNQFDATASADYVSNDYVQCGIEIVLETLFDAHQHHLTEKIFRPIACGKPFMLAATPGSLEYVRSYGFRTFSGLIDESYDCIVDPLERLNAIVTEMQRIANLDVNSKQQLWQDLAIVAQYNKDHFFNEERQKSIFDEFANNYRIAFEKLKSQPLGRHWKNNRATGSKFIADTEPGTGCKIARDRAVETWLAQSRADSLSNTAS